MHRLRRALAALVPALLIPGLVACGATKTGYGDKTVSGFSGASVTGAFGKQVKLDWKSNIDYPQDTKVRTLIKGTGPAIPSGRTAYVNFYVGNASTTAVHKSWVYSSLSESPQGMQMDPTLGPVYKSLLAGAHVGDRREAIATSEDVVGSSGNPTFDIGNHDTLLLVIDVLKAGPDETPHDVAKSRLPKLQVGKNGKPSGFDFTGIKKPSPNGKLLRSVIKQGTGATVTKDDTLTVNYLGMTYKGAKPFDESYTKKPAQFALSGVVKGWTDGLAGLKVGSRVLLQIPPSLGYGDKAQKGIPANSTLYFVVDIIKAGTSSTSSGTGQ